MKRMITPMQLKALHTAFTRAGWDDEQRHEFIHQYTDGRTDSTKELTLEEAKGILDKFNKDAEKIRQIKQQEAKNILRCIYHLSMQISFLNKGFTSDTAEDREMNKAKINIWARKHTKFRKNITLMTVEELADVKKQLEAIARKENEKQED